MSVKNRDLSAGPYRTPEVPPPETWMTDAFEMLQRARKRRAQLHRRLKIVGAVLGVIVGLVSCMYLPIAWPDCPMHALGLFCASLGLIQFCTIFGIHTAAGSTR